MRVLVTGAAGQLGRDLVDVLGGSVPRGGGANPTPSLGAGSRGKASACDVVAADHRSLDVSDRSQVAEALEQLRPDVVVHCAAWTAVDACEADPGRAFAVNAMGTRHVAEAAGRHGAHVVYVSTDYVFDGTSEVPYVEWDRPNPLSVYGRSKLGGELELGADATVVRTSWVCGYHGANMVRTVLRMMAQPGPLRFVDDQRGSPTFTADLAVALAEVSRARLPGVFHLTNQGETTWFEFARAVVEAAGGDTGRVQPITTAELDPPRPAPRPANSVLDNLAWRCLGAELLPPWQDGLGRLLAALSDDGGAS